MNSLSFKKKFVHGLRWNSIESILYYSLLAAHQIGLRAISHATLYGSMGTLFALVFLTIVFFNFGLDFSIGPFFKIYSSNKKLFKSYLVKQLIIQILIYSFVALGMTVVLVTKCLPIKGMPQISCLLALIISLLVITEGIKKSMRIILQFAFLTHITALIELFYIISYISVVWGIYLIYRQISLYTIFLPMLVISFISIAILSMVIYRFYKNIPETASKNTFSWKQVSFNRIPNYGYQLTRELFTSNFLIPFFAIKFGLTLAALLELVSAFNQFITIIIKKIFGITGQALLSHAKNMKIDYKRHVFEMTNRNLYRILMVVISSIFLLYRPALAFKVSQSSSNNSSLAFLFFFLLFSENFILLYEKWFIIEEKTMYLILFNGTLLTIFWVLLQMPYTFSPFILLAILILLRFSAYFCLIIISWYKWQIKVPWGTKNFYLASAILLFLGYILLFQ